MRLIFRTKNYRFFQVMGFARFLETRTIVRSTVNSTASRGHANINWSTIVPLIHLAYVWQMMQEKQNLQHGPKPSLWKWVHKINAKMSVQLCGINLNITFFFKLGIEYMFKNVLKKLENHIIISFKFSNNFQIILQLTFSKLLKIHIINDVEWYVLKVQILTAELLD